jgi:hypothetical protein
VYGTSTSAWWETNLPMQNIGGRIKLLEDGHTLKIALPNCDKNLPNKQYM